MVISMLDSYGREINYLRISLTDRCNLHCCYCRPDIAEKIAHEEILRYEEILRVCRAAIALGITRFKITGGEPLLRKGCAEFISGLKKLAGAEQVTLTTNGTFLAQQLPQLAAAGLDGVNFSLDTTDELEYEKLTGGSIKPVLAGIAAAAAAGMPLKINCVLVRTDEDLQQRIFALLALAQKVQAPLRFIELMPLECNKNVPPSDAAQVREIFARCGLRLTSDASCYGNGPAVYYRVSGWSIPVGFIEPMHNKFCGSCNRVRLTANGLLKTCLYADAALDVKKLLRSGADAAALQEALRAAVSAKPPGHGLEHRRGAFSMNMIGG